MTADLRLALRRLASQPGYTALLVIVIAVGIGAATTVFSIVDQLLLRPAPFAYADRLVDVLDTSRTARGGGNTLTLEKIDGWQHQPALFERFEGAAPRQFDITGEGEPERISGQVVTTGLFPMLGVEPRLGRGFTESDGRPGAERVVLLSDELWRRRFAAQDDVLGKRINLNDEDYTIVGVMPHRFHLYNETDAVWTPIDVRSSLHDSTVTANFYGFGRLARGVAMSDAPRIADQIADRLQRDAPIARTWDLSLQRKRIAYVDATTRAALLVLLGAVGFVLVITCANVATLSLSQWSTRVREMAIRAALGSGRARLVRSILLESVLTASIGGALGILLASWGVRGVLASAPETLAPRITTTIELDGRVIAIAVMGTLLTGLVVGLLPAIHGSKPDVEQILRGTSNAARSAAGRAPSLLVIVEVAFSVVLLVGAALMARTLIKLEAIDPGFDLNGLITLHVDLPTDRYPTAESRQAFFDALFPRLKAIPGVLDAAVSTGVPPNQGGFTWGDLQSDDGRSTGRVMVPINTVSSEYFRTLKIPVIAGRTFGPREASDAVIVSESMAERLAPGGRAVGRRYRFDADGSWRTIVGVVGNVESRAAREDRTRLQEYHPRVTITATPVRPAPAPQRRSFTWTLLVVRAQNPVAAMPDIKRQIWAMDATQPVDRVALAADIYAAAFGRQRFVLTLMTTFSLIALVLTAAGLFGVLSQLVIRRTREIGIRMALGAQPSDLLQQIVARGLVLAACGGVIGTIAALGLTGMLRSLLFGISSTDPASYAVVSAVLLAVAFAACWVPARMAMHVNPAVALRTDN